MRPAAALRLLLNRLFLACFTWNFALGMTYILIPLYAYELGMSGMSIGSLIAVPMALQMVLNLFGGTYTDRFGGQRVSVIAAAAGVIAGLVFAISASFAGLMAAQLCWMISRAFYWPATWSIAAELPGERSTQFSLLNSVTAVGGIVGTAAAGLIVAAFGFRVGFWAFVLAATMTLALLSTFRAPTHHPPEHRPMWHTYIELLRRPAIHYAVLCAYISALPFSLSQSFYPILFVEKGFSPDEAGWMLALRGVGQVAAGVAIGRFLRHVGTASVSVTAGIAVGLCAAASAYFDAFLPIALVVVGIGFGTGMMTLYFQLLISEITAQAQRGSAMAMGGLGWGISHMSTPLIMGAIKDHFGLHAAFYVLATIAIVCALALEPMHRWAFRHVERR